MSRSRATRSRPVLLVLILIALSACRAPTDGGAIDPPTPSPTDSGPSPSSSPSVRPSTARRHARTAPPSSQPTGSTPRYADAGPVGAMATAYLRDDRARSLVVEVDFVEGHRPSGEALSHVEQVLERETDKPGGVEILVDDEISGRGDGYTFRRIEQLEEQHRDERSSGSRAVLYVLYLDGDLADEEGTLGVAYRASGVAIFQERVRSAATSLVRPGSIERAVLTHEAGHVLGLVNIGYTSRHDHEDPDHPKHSRYEDSVMYWAIEDVSVASLLSGGPPSDFDRFDRDDLAMRRR